MVLYSTLIWEERACQCHGEIPHLHVFYMACEDVYVILQLNFPSSQVHTQPAHLCDMYTPITEGHTVDFSCTTYEKRKYYVNVYICTQVHMKAI